MHAVETLFQMPALHSELSAAIKRGEVLMIRQGGSNYYVIRGCCPNRDRLLQAIAARQSWAFWSDRFLALAKVHCTLSLAELAGASLHQLPAS